MVTIDQILFRNKSVTCGWCGRTIPDGTRDNDETMPEKCRRLLMQLSPMLKSQGRMHKVNEVYVNTVMCGRRRGVEE
jgi:hypothetical protein